MLQCCSVCSGWWCRPGWSAVSGRLLAADSADSSAHCSTGVCCMRGCCRHCMLHSHSCRSLSWPWVTARDSLQALFDQSLIREGFKFFLKVNGISIKCGLEGKLTFSVKIRKTFVHDFLLVRPLERKAIIFFLNHLLFPSLWKASLNSQGWNCNWRRKEKCNLVYYWSREEKIKRQINFGLSKEIANNVKMCSINWDWIEYL